MKTIEDIQGAYAQVVSPLVPPGYSAVVKLLDGKGTKKRKNAAARNWDPLSGSVSITFVKPEAPVARPEKAQSPSRSEEKAPALALPTPLAEAIRALDTAEHKVPFVALKWFRDQFLPSFGVAWAVAPYAGQETIKEAIDRGLFLTSKVQNPKAPAYPVTAIQLNRDLPEIQRILASAPAVHNRVFRPVEITGEALSQTIIRERR